MAKQVSFISPALGDVTSKEFKRFIPEEGEIFKTSDPVNPMFYIRKGTGLQLLGATQAGGNLAGVEELKALGVDINSLPSFNISDVMQDLPLMTGQKTTESFLPKTQLGSIQKQLQQQGQFAAPGQIQEKVIQPGQPGFSQIQPLTGAQQQQLKPGGGLNPLTSQPVSTTGSLSGTLGIQGGPAGQIKPPVAPQAPKEDVIIQGKTGFEGMEPNKKANIVNGLNAAWQRQQEGKSNEQDDANLKYAQKIGIWSPPGITDDMSPEEQDLFDAQQKLSGDFSLPNLAAGTPFEDIAADYSQALQQINQPLTDVQNKVIETLSNQPGQLETLKKLKEDFGQEALIAELAKLSKAAQPLEDALENLPQDIADRYEDIGLTEAQRRRTLAVEAVPLTKSLDKIMKGKQVTLEQLKFNSNEISDIMVAVLSDQEKEGGILMQQLEFASDNKKMQENILKTQFDIALASIQSSLESTNPDIYTVKEEDKRGNVTVIGINKQTGEKVWEQNLGGIAKGFKAAGGGGGGIGIGGGTSLTKTQLNTAKANFFKDDPSNTLADFNALSTEEKLIWYKGGLDAGDKEFLSKDYFKAVMTNEQLKDAAKEAGFTKGGFLGIGVGQAGIDEYLSYLDGIISQYRNAGYTDKEILKLMQ